MADKKGKVTTHYEKTGENFYSVAMMSKEDRKKLVAENKKKHGKKKTAS